MGRAMTVESDELARLLARGAAERDAGRPEAAERLFGEAAARWPRAPEPHHHLGGLHRRAGRLDQAEACYRRALALAPGAGATRRVLGTLLLSQGRFAEGFELFEARHELAGMGKPALPFPEWRGGPVAGQRLLIWPEQGLGDQIQFARFAPVLQAMGAKVTLVCAPGLARLFAASLGVTVVAAEGEIAFEDPDAWVMAGSLAARLGVTVETIPAAPYLRAPEPGPRADGGLRVGLMTRGNPAHANDANRSLDAAQANELAARLAAAGAAVVDLAPAASGARDFADTAAIMAGLDLVVSVDTAVAHLAGAMGTPCRMLLPGLETDWRWLRGRSDSPWYPSMRLYRQRPGEGWGPVIERLAADVAGGRQAGRSRQQRTSEPGQGAAS
jgi:tetratricopeptide (TPR) repeat protein